MEMVVCVVLAIEFNCKLHRSRKNKKKKFQRNSKEITTLKTMKNDIRHSRETNTVITAPVITGGNYR